MQSELKPCPFCGSDNICPSSFDIQCQECKAMMAGDPSNAADRWNRRAALSDQERAVEPVAHIVEGQNGGDPRVYLTQKYDPRNPEFWLNEEARARHRVTPLYTRPPHREGEDSAEVIARRVLDTLRAADLGDLLRASDEVALPTIARALAATRSGSAINPSGGWE